MKVPEQRDHEPQRVSNRAMGGSHGSAEDNTLRFVPGSGRGHVESHFLKANSADGLRALWIKHTLLARPRNAEHDVAEVWAVAFARESLTGRVQTTALKRTFPLREAHFARAPFRIAVGGAVLEQGHSRACFAASDADGGAEWDVRYDCPEESFRPFPYAAMYEGRFPRSKSLTPVPLARAEGLFKLGPHVWDVRDFVLAQGHNWGESHAHAYAWTQVNHFAGVENAWLEALTGKVRVGPLTTPWLSVAALHLEGELHRFDGARAMLSREVHIDTRSYALVLRHADAELRLKISAQSHAFAGLRYEDPSGSALACLNSKLAYAEVALTTHGRTRTLKSEVAALELGTRRNDHGLTILV